MKFTEYAFLLATLILLVLGTARIAGTRTARLFKSIDDSQTQNLTVIR